MNDADMPMRTLTAFVAAVALIAVLAPAGVDAAAEVFVLKDANSSSKAQVDDGELRVGDGRGPISVEDVDNARQPFSREISVEIDDGTTLGTGSFSVPDGKRLVLEHVSGQIYLGAGQTTRVVQVYVTGPSYTHSHYLVPFKTQDGVYAVSQPIKLYVDPAQASVHLSLSRAPASSGDGNAYFTFSGYLVDI